MSIDDGSRIITPKRLFIRQEIVTFQCGESARIPSKAGGNVERWSTMSKFLRGLGNFVFIIGGLLGFVLSLLVVYAVAGGGGVIGSLFLFPVAFMLVPFYTLFVYGSWNLLLINYGSAIIAWTLHKIADGMDEEPKVLAD